MRTPRRLPAALLAAFATLALSGCGNKHEDGVLVGETEGIYIDLGEVKYQVQLSRILNPANAEDAAYLRGVLPGEDELEAGETWFGVWMRAENESREAHPRAEEFEIKDTLGNTFEPLAQPTNILTWDEQPEEIGPQEVLPISGSIAAQSSIQGSLLLFKLTYETLENRPLELEMRNPENPQEVGTVDLDV